MDTPVHPSQQGYHLSELLITLFIIGIMASMAMSHLYLSYKDKELQAGRHSTLSALQNIRDLAATTLGTLPMNYGMSQVVRRFSGLEEVLLPENDAIGMCPTKGGKIFKLPSGAYITDVNDTWIDANGNADNICVALEQYKSTSRGKTYFWVTIPRDSGIEVAEIKVESSLYMHSFADSFLWKEYFRSRMGSVGRFANRFLKAQDYTYVQGVFVITDSQGNPLNLKGKELWDGILINGLPLSPMTAGERYEAEDAAAAIIRESELYLSSGFAQSYKEWIDSKGIDGSYVFDSFTNVKDYSLEDYTYYSGIRSIIEEDRRKAKPSVIQYYDKNTNTFYQLAGSSFVSPVKLSLNGVSAKLNSDNHFAFDIDGKAGKLVPIITTGGLNHNEAWLATDRNHDGFWQKGVADGRDVFGDHMGQYRSGYDDLQALYKHAIKKDAQGKRYIPIKKLSFLEKQQANVARLSSAPKQFDPSIDLKLLTREKKVVFAGDYVDKIYVDYQDVNELDAQKRNWIRQRASVHYLTGQTVTSADQWFQAGFIFKPIDKTMAPKLLKKDK